MDYGNAELCSQCGERMFIIPNPSEEMLISSPGYQMFKETILSIHDHFDPEDARMAFCDPCGVTSIIGPKVSISGIVVGDN